MFSCLKQNQFWNIEKTDKWYSAVYTQYLYQLVMENRQMVFSRLYPIPISTCYEKQTNDIQPSIPNTYINLLWKTDKPSIPNTYINLLWKTDKWYSAVYTQYLYQIVMKKWKILFFDDLVVTIKSRNFSIAKVLVLSGFILIYQGL